MADRSSGRPLEGLRVIALEQAVAAPLCTRHLADMGADVVKVERPPDGDFARAYDAVVHGESAYFVWLNYGKRSIALDLGSVGDRATFDDLLGGADAFVHNLGPGAVDRLGYGWPALHARWPRLISCAISGFGPDGPYRDHKAFDLLIQGESGLLSVTGTPDAMARVGVSIGDISAGLYAVIGILGALRERDRTGEGSQLEISMLECLAEWMAVPGLFERYGGWAPGRSGMHHPSIAPYGPYHAADGRPVLIAVQNGGQWERLCGSVLGNPALATDPRFITNEGRVAARAELDGTLEHLLTSITTRTELLERLAAADVPSGAVNEVGDLLEHPQLAARGAWVEVETPSGPARLPRSPLGLPGPRRVPGVGADGAAVRAGDGPP